MNLPTQQRPNFTIREARIGLQKSAPRSICRPKSCQRLYNRGRSWVRYSPLLQQKQDYLKYLLSPRLATTPVQLSLRCRHKRIIGAYISSGTWSLMGIEVPEPIVTDQALALNFTNEGGVENTFRFLKKYHGALACARVPGGHGHKPAMRCLYTQITQLAERAKRFTALIDPDADVFLPPGDMPARIAEYCKHTGQTPPSTTGEILRCVLESLALKYRWVLEKLEVVRGGAIDVIHVVGGGAQNRILCQFTADATGAPVIAGPIEATAIGNIAVQAIACGLIGSISEAREVIRRSFNVITYDPQHSAGWDEAYERFLKITGLPS